MAAHNYNHGRCTVCRAFKARLAEDEAPCPGPDDTRDQWRSLAIERGAAILNLETKLDAAQRQLIERQTIAAWQSKVYLLLLQDNAWAAKRLEAVQELAHAWSEKGGYGMASVFGDAILDAVNQYDQPPLPEGTIRASFTFRTPKSMRVDGSLIEVFPGDGYGFIHATDDALVIDFDCAGVLCSSSITYEELQTELAKKGLSVTWVGQPESLSVAALGALVTERAVAWVTVGRGQPDFAGINKSTMGLIEAVDAYQARVKEVMGEPCSVNLDSGTHSAEYHAGGQCVWCGEFREKLRCIECGKTSTSLEKGAGCEWCEANNKEGVK